jgi:TatD DNase family protein
MPLIDTHCHLDFDSFDGQRDDIVQRAIEAEVTRLINPGTDLPRSRAAIQMAETYPGVYAGVGIHPNSTADFTESMIDEIRALAAHPKVVAIGEIGLDYYRHWSSPEKQRHAFEAQLALAAKLNLPVIIHNREADADSIAMLHDWVAALPEPLRSRPGVMHSFSASQEIADQAVEIGFCLGFTGPITFKNADSLRRIAASLPEDRILIETDSPFLTPHPYRGKNPNEPAYVRFVAERIAALRLISDETFAQLSTANAERLFNLPHP